MTKSFNNIQSRYTNLLLYSIVGFLFIVYYFRTENKYIKILYRGEKLILM